MKLNMKRMIVSALIAAAVLLSGCALFQTLQMDAKWVPRTGDKDWTLLVSAEMPSANTSVPHAWSIDWGDGTKEEWGNGEKNWPKYPLDHSRFVDIHQYTLSGDYVVIVTFDNRMSSSIEITVDVGR